MSSHRGDDDLVTRTPYRFSRRTLLAAVPGLMLLAAGVACGDDDEDEDTPADSSAEGTASAATATTAPTGSEATKPPESTPAPSTGASPAASDGEWTFTDDRGITVTLPKRPERIIAQTTSAAILWDFGIQPVAVYGPSRMADGSNDFQAGAIDFDTVEVIGDYGQLDLEKVVALNADLYIDLTYGGTSLWYLTEEEQQGVEAILPTIGLSMQKQSVLDAIARFRELATLLGAEVDSPEQAQVKADFDDAEADLKAAIEEKEGLTVLVVSPAVDTLYVASPEYMVDLHYLRDLGLDVVQPEVDDFWELVSWEQANKYPADLILIDARNTEIPEQVAGGTWASLPAVAAGQTGPWYAGAPYSYARLTPILNELAEIIRESDAGLV